MKNKLRYQKRIPGGRKSVGTGVEKKIKDTIEHLARSEGCTKSFVITYFLCKGMGIKMGKDEVI